MKTEPIAAIALILGIGVAAQWLAWRLRVPSILLLLIGGFAVGRASGIIDPDRLLGELLQPVVSLSVALVLFEGGLTLRREELRHAGRAIRNLITVGAMVTWGAAAVAARLLLDLDWFLSTLLGAILVVTGPTVIGPLLRHIRPRSRVASVVKWEGILIDPIGALLALLVFEAAFAGEFQRATTVIVSGILQTILYGTAVGLVAAGLIVLLLRRYQIPDYLHNAFTLAAVVGAAVTANNLHEESGLLAATVMGIALANQHIVPTRAIVEFKESVRVLLIGGLFVVLAARVRIDALEGLEVRTGLFLAVIILIVRPLAVYVSTLRTNLDWRERVFVAWMAPRGIVAAAVASVFALRLQEAGVFKADRLVPVTFAVIVGTILVYGLTAPLLARWLKLADASPQGALIVGAHAWARDIASALKREGVRVVLADTDRRNIAAARMDDLPVFFGSVLSEYAMNTMDLDGVSRLLALTSNDEMNTLAAQHFMPTFGRAQSFQLAPKSAGGRAEAVAKHQRGRILFGDQIDHDVIARRYTAGHRIKRTQLTKQFDFEAFRSRYGDSAVPMFLVDDGSLVVLAADITPSPKAGQTLIALVDPALAEADAPAEQAPTQA